MVHRTRSTPRRTRLVPCTAPLLLLLASCGGGGGAEPPATITPTAPPTPASSTPGPTSPASTERAITTTSPTTSAADTVGSTVPPAVAAAVSVFDAWTRSDPSAPSSNATAAVNDFLARYPASTAAWDGPQCEGAAGSTYCSWTSAELTVALRVSNQASVVDEARLLPPPDGVAVWPITTATEAANTQQSVDEGHSPWQLDADTVATMFAENISGLDQPQLESIGTDPVTIRVTAGELELDLTITQPARTGAGGIWAIAEIQAHASSS